MNKFNNLMSNMENDFKELSECISLKEKSNNENVTNNELIQDKYDKLSKEIKDNEEYLNICYSKETIINLDEYETIILNFVGKDSIVYNQKFLIPCVVSNSLKELIKNKKPDDKVFSVKSDDVNDFLNDLLEGLTAKVFRTAWAERIMKEEMKNLKFVEFSKDKMTVDYNTLQIKILLLKVSIYLNHKKEIKNKEKQNEKIKKLEEKIKEETVKEKKKILKLKLEYTIESNGINQSTALTNYINPKCVKKVCDKLKVPYEKIYSKTLMLRFQEFLN